MPLKSELLEKLATVNLDVKYARALGDLIWKEGDDTPILDLVGGFGATLLGHNHPDIKKVIVNHFNDNRPIHAQGSYRKTSEELASKLVDLVQQFGKYRVILTNSGTETVEAAIKHAVLKKNLEWQQHRKNFILPTESFEPVFLSLTRGFHGKTTGAVQLTYNPKYRNGLQGLGPHVFFVEPDNHAEIESLILQHTHKFNFENVNQTLPGQMAFNSICGFFLEPLQGEGGINALSAKTAKFLNDLSKKHRIPLIVDEIQSGCGRTGTFLFSEQIGLHPDYILLSKSLGGGVAKIGALLIESTEYVEDFSLTHSSTFAEDDFSSGVALATLEIISLQKNLSEIREKGKIFQEKLRKLQSQYPSVIKDIRGTGLMLGIEFKPIGFDQVDTLQMIDQSENLNLLLAGHLLHIHKIRILPTLQAPRVFRLEPSMFITEEQMDLFVESLSEVCALIFAEDIEELVSFIFPDKPKKQVLFMPEKRIFANETPRGENVAFVSHLFDESHMHALGFPRFQESEIRYLLDRFLPIAGYSSLDKNVIFNSAGKPITLHHYNLSIPSRMFTSPDPSMRKKILGIIDDVLDDAVAKNCKILGLGQFTSIITQNGTSIKRNDIHVTTGNHLTASAGVQAIRSLRKESQHLVVVGAAGNIAKMMTRLLAQEFSTITLVGRKISSNLTATAEQIKDSGASVHLTTDFNVLKDADIIISATSATEPIIFPEHCKSGVIIVDLSVPDNVSSAVLESRPDVTVIKGGLVRFKDDFKLRIPGSGLKAPLIFACMAETVVLGLSEMWSNFSYGDLELEKVHLITKMMREQGFDFEVEYKCLSPWSKQTSSQNTLDPKHIP